MSCFIWKIRICNTLTAKGDQICPSLFYQKFCVLRLCETANCDHRNRNCTFDLCYKIPVKTAMDQARRPHKFIVEVYHTGYMESIYTAFLFQVCSYCCCVLYALSSLEEMYEKAMSRSRRKQVFCINFMDSVI